MSEIIGGSICFGAEAEGLGVVLRWGDVWGTWVHMGFLYMVRRGRYGRTIHGNCGSWGDGLLMECMGFGFLLLCRFL